MDHSIRVIRRIGEIVLPLEGTRQELNRHELLTLLAAAFVHDIGMQDLRVAGRLDTELSAADYDLIRREHPHRSYELIRSIVRPRDRDAVDLGLKDDHYLRVIASIAKGHGTEFFDEMVAELKKPIYSSPDAPIRGPLLASLLMMGDELDLHEERARFSVISDKNPVSLLHNLKHHYVASSGVIGTHGSDDMRRTPHIVFNFPSTSEEYDILKRWIVDKIRSQGKRVAGIISEQTSGLLIWESEPKVETVVSSFDRRKLPYYLVIPTLVEGDKLAILFAYELKFGKFRDKSWDEELEVYYEGFYSVTYRSGGEYKKATIPEPSDYDISIRHATTDTELEEQAFARFIALHYDEPVREDTLSTEILEQLASLKESQRYALFSDMEIVDCDREYQDDPFG